MTKQLTCTPLPNGRVSLKCEGCDWQAETTKCRAFPHRCEVSATYITNLSNDHYLHQCRNCEWRLEAETDEPVEHLCGSPTVRRLGDRVEDALESIGITKERWLAVKEYVGANTTCNCESRKAWLSRLDEKLELGEKLETFKNLFGWK